jgi:hypothetical protein
VSPGRSRLGICPKIGVFLPKFSFRVCDGSCSDRLATSLHDIPESGENMDNEYYAVTSEAYKSPLEALLDPSNRDVSHIIRHSLEGALFAHIQASRSSTHHESSSVCRLGGLTLMFGSS